MSRRFVPLAEIARPHGVQGELRLKIYNADSDLLLRRPPIRLELPSGEQRECRIETARAVNRALLVRLSAVADRDQAEELRGAKILVPRDAFPPLEEGEFYACDVEGARAVLEGGEEIGKVLALRSYPTCDVLVVDRGAGREVEVPLLDAYVAGVEPDHGVVRIVTLEGLD